ncbi:MAG: hypothetical protein ACQEQF_10780 [Bacillota bacterium]
MLKKKLTYIVILMFFLLNIIPITVSAEEIGKVKNGIVYGNYVVTDENIKEAKKITRIKGYLGLEAKKIDMPKLEKIEGALYITSESSKVEKINLPKLKEIEHLLISFRKDVSVNLEELYLPKLEKIEDGIRIRHILKTFKKLKLPNLKYVGGSIYIGKNQKLNEINLKSLKKVGSIRIFLNDQLKHINLSSLEQTKENSILSISQTEIEILNLNNLKKTGGLIFWDNEFLKKIHFNNLKEIQNSFSMRWNNNLKEIYTPRLKKVGTDQKGRSIKTEGKYQDTILIQVKKIPDYKGKIGDIKFSIIKEEIKK